MVNSGLPFFAFGANADLRTLRGRRLSQQRDEILLRCENKSIRDTSGRSSARSAQTTSPAQVSPTTRPSADLVGLVADYAEVANVQEWR